MNNLIIGVISIVIISIITASGFFYGGNIYTEQQIEGEVAKYLNETSQVNGALTMYESEGNEFDENFKLETLVNMEYLREIPEGWTEQDGTIGVMLSDGLDEKNESICFESNKSQGFQFLVSENDVIPYSKDTNLAIPLCSKSGIEKVQCCIM